MVDDGHSIKGSSPSLHLSVVALQPDYGTRAAGVPLMMRASIKNHGVTPVARVALQVQTQFFSTGPTGSESPVQRTELPSVLIDRIEPGETVERQFQVFFATRGQHVVQVTLPNDALPEDNRRWAVVSLDAAESALIVDGDEAHHSAYYLEAIFAPGTLAKTGVQPVAQPLRYLRDATVDELLRYQVIYLLDVPALDGRSQANLLEYLQRGGGVACVVGPKAQATYYAQA